MARPARPWFRFYVEAIHDRKLRRMRPEHRWLFVVCLAAARQSPEPGWLLVGVDDPIGWDDLVDLAAMPLKQVEQGIDALQATAIIAFDKERSAWFVPSWDTRQFESDDVTARTTKHRSKERSNDVPGNAPETETEADTESSSSSSSVPDEVWITLGRKKLAIANDVKNVPSWLKRVMANDRLELGQVAQDLWDRYEITPSHLADVLAAGGSSPSLNHLRKKIPA